MSHSKSTTYFSVLRRDLVISLAIFSFAYWIAAFVKDYNVDEFFSWVYTSTCTIKEILTLKEFGIGHPPLFHLLQKTVQTFLPVVQPISLRLVNYLVGLGFIVVLIKFLSTYKRIPLYFYACAASAGILNIFVYSRMWGLVCLFSTLLVWKGENVLTREKTSQLYIIILIIAAGFFADYNFVLLIPYILIVFFYRKKYLLPSASAIYSIVLIGWLYSIFQNTAPPGELLATLKTAFINIEQLIYAMGLMFFNFWSQETFFLAVFVALFSVIIYFIKTDQRFQVKPFSLSRRLLIFLLGFLLMEIVLKFDIFRTLHLLPVLFVMLIWLFKDARLIKKINLQAQNTRLFFSILGSSLIVLWANQFFWRGLIDARFVIVLLPIFHLLVYRNFSKRILNIFACIYIFSGLLYLNSSGLADNYPPPAVQSEKPVIFMDAYAYSTQYFCGNEKSVESPYIIHMEPFDKFCKLCQMGTPNVPFDSLTSFYLVWRATQDPANAIPSYFNRVNKSEPNLTWFDQLRFKYLHPVYTRRYAIFEYVENQHLIPTDTEN